jgi:hypothetical protein
MFHLAFSTGEEHASAAFHSIARAQSRGFEPRWPQLKTRLSRRPAIEHILRRHRLTAHRTPEGPDVRSAVALFPA